MIPEKAKKSKSIDNNPKNCYITDMEQLTKKERKELRHHEMMQAQLEAEKQAKLKRFLLWGGAALVIALSLFGLIKLASLPAPNQSTTGAAPKAVAATDMVIGPKDAKVTMIEYSDFQCPACAAYYPLIKQLLADYDGKMRFVYRSFPLESIHKNAQLAGQAAYAASKQGKFWEMHDQLFVSQQEWANEQDPTQKFVSYAQALGLNSDQFTLAMTSDEARDYVNNQQAEAIDIGVNSTPTFYINGKKVPNGSNADAIKRLIDAELAAK